MMSLFLLPAYLPVIISAIVSFPLCRSQTIQDAIKADRAVFDRDHTTCEIIASRDYGCETHAVTTSDGYVLTLHRVVNPLRKQRGKPVLLQHGRLASDIIWVIQSGFGDLGTGNEDVPVENELAFALARRGYDVWLGNARGSTYSQKHVTLSPFSRQFWMFSNDEKVLIDLPAMLDYVLKTTGKSHSLGSSMMVGLMSRTTKYNEVVKPAILSSPVWFFTQEAGLFERIMVRPIRKLFLKNPGPFAQNKMAAGWFLVTSQNMNNLDSSRLPVYLSHLPGGESTWSFAHTLNPDRKSVPEVRMFDYGNEGTNTAVYGSTLPPEYRIDNVTSRYLCTIRSLNDEPVQPKDYLELKRRLRVNLLDEYVVPVADFSHLDHQLSNKAGVAENSHILQLLKKYA